MKFLYLIIDVAAVLVPLLFTFYPTIRFYKVWKAALPAILLTAFFFIAWDVLYTKIQVWGFNPAYLCGIYIFNLPIEEILFFICIPYSCLFTYYALQKFVFDKHQLASVLWGLIPAVACWIIAFSFRDKLYTVATFMLLGLAFLYAAYNFRDKIIVFLKCYMILLIPFFIVNGILTGTGIDGVVVWYNKKCFIGLHLLTIPVEDIFYGMLLILMNVILFEKLRSRLGMSTV
jgi:lycopene cyclase domain-containing protein